MKPPKEGMMISRITQKLGYESNGIRALCILSFSAIIFSTRQAMADTNFFDLSLEQLLSAKIISASKTEETVEKTPAAVYVISKEDIARSGVTSIPDALRMAPGVDVAQGSTGSWAINIRGFNKGLANQLLVMIDGRTIYNPLFAGTYWELQNLPLEDIERIEVIRGPGGTLWGANAVNGVINIITKKARDTQGILVSAAAGTYMHDEVLGQHGGKTGDDSYYRVYGQHLNDGSLRLPNGGDAPESLRDSRTGFRFDRGENLTVSGDAYANTSSQLVSIPQLTAPYATTQEDGRTSQGANLLAHWKKSYADGSLLSLQSYVDYTQRDQAVLDDQEDIFDFDAQYNFHPMDRNEIITGGGYRLVHEAIGNTPTLSIAPATNNLNTFNVFAQDKIALAPDRWFLTLGSKVEHNSFTGLEFEPNARLQWFPDNRQTIWTAVSRAVRTPSPLENELNLDASVIPPFTPPANLALPIKFDLAANPDFRSEDVIAYELGYRNKITPAVSADIAAFSNFYKGLSAQQLIDLAFIPNAITPQYVLFETDQANLMSAETYGAEAAADWNVNSSWKLSGGVSALEMFLHQPSTSQSFGLEAEESQSPHLQANLRSYWNINNSWSFDTSAYYVDRLAAFDMPAYVRLDTNIGWKVGNGLQLNFVGQNLLRSAHREFNSPTDLNAAEVPRSFYAKMTCKF